MIVPLGTSPLQSWDYPGCSPSLSLNFPLTREFPDKCDAPLYNVLWMKYRLVLDMPVASFKLPVDTHSTEPRSNVLSDMGLIPSARPSVV